MLNRNAFSFIPDLGKSLVTAATVNNNYSNYNNIESKKARVKTSVY